MQNGMYKDVYSLTSGKFIPSLNAVDNEFIRQVAALATSSASELKYVTVVQKDFINNRGEIAQKGVKAVDKSVIDICKLSPLMGLGNSKNMLEEVSMYRRNMLKLPNLPYNTKTNTLLFIDYILSSCLCYVEVFGKGARVDKFFATRNRFIAGGLANVPPNESAKYANYLAPLTADYVTGNLRVLKLNAKKEGYSITQPRSSLNFNDGIKITPVFLMYKFLEGIQPVLKTRAVKFTYVKDNASERDMIVTLSNPILSDYYGDIVKATSVLMNVGLSLSRGYVKLPEIGLSKYDDTGVRALNVARITSVSLVDAIDKRFVDIDFNQIIPTFKLAVDSCNSLNSLSHMADMITDSDTRLTDILTAKGFLHSYVDSQFSIGTTSFLKFLHVFMLKNNYMFNGYSGTAEKTAKTSKSFNLGVE